MKVPIPSQRAIAYLILCMMIAAFGFFIVIPVSSKYIQLDKEAAILQNKRAKLEAIGSQKPVIAKQIEAITKNSRQRRYYLANSKSSLATAELTQLVSTIITTNKAELISTRSVVGNNQHDIKELNQIGVQVDIRCDIEMLTAILFRLESGTPLLFIDKFQLHAQDIPKEKSNKGVNNLRIKFIVFGFSLKEKNT